MPDTTDIIEGSISENTENMGICWISGDPYPNDDLIEVVIDGDTRIVNEDELINSSTYYYCESCEEYTSSINTCRDLNYYCEDCFIENTSECRFCGENVNNRDLSPYTEDCCTSCYDRLIECDDCGGLEDSHEVYSYDNNLESFTLCSSCYNSRIEDDDEREQEDEYQRERVEGRFGSWDSYLDNPKICSYDTRPKWSFNKQNFEKDRYYPFSQAFKEFNERSDIPRNVVYLGIELEMNFKLKDFEKIADIVKKYFPKNHIFKNDGSIGEGAELVLAPYTLNSLKKVNLRAMLKELVDAGATSYKSHKCGIHIHCGEKDPIVINKIRALFAHSYDEIFKFSKRRKDEFNQWCQIPNHGDLKKRFSPEKWTGKYTAVNSSPKHTTEFRFFRGTLNYDRFKANMLFADSIINYCKQASFISCNYSEAWKIYCKWLSGIPEYSELVKYFKKNGLFNTSVKSKNILISIKENKELQQKINKLVRKVYSDYDLREMRITSLNEIQNGLKLIHEYQIYLYKELQRIRSFSDLLHSDQLNNLERDYNSIVDGLLYSKTQLLDYKSNIQDKLKNSL